MLFSPKNPLPPLWKEAAGEPDLWLNRHRGPALQWFPEMAGGDAQRVWFPEMIETLRSQWQAGISFGAVINLRDGRDAMLQ
jgi:hypothetical protein